MKLYVWSSEFNANYTSGYLMAMANSAEEARDKIRAEARKEYPWVWDDEGQPWDCNEDRRRALEEDLAKEPETPDALLISGSE